MFRGGGASARSRLQLSDDAVGGMSPYSILPLNADVRLLVQEALFAVDARLPGGVFSELLRAGADPTVDTEDGVETGSPSASSSTL